MQFDNGLIKELKKKNFSFLILNHYPWILYFMHNKWIGLIISGEEENKKKIFNLYKLEEIEKEITTVIKYRILHFIMSSIFIYYYNSNLICYIIYLLSFIVIFNMIYCYILSTWYHLSLYSNIILMIIHL